MDRYQQDFNTRRARGAFAGRKQLDAASRVHAHDLTQISDVTAPVKLINQLFARAVWDEAGNLVVTRGGEPVYA